MIVRTASKMRAHLDDFSGKLSSGLSQPARRFVSEALYGIAARGSVRLSDTAENFLAKTDDERAEAEKQIAICEEILRITGS